MILKPSGSDVKLLPLSAVEAYVLSRLDGQLDLDAVAEITGIDAAEVARVGAYLVQLGAAVRVGGRPIQLTPRSAGSYGLRPITETRRRDPRAEETIHPRPMSTPAERPPRAPAVTIATAKPQRPRTVRPAKSKTMAPPKSKTMAPPKSRTMAPPKTMRPPRTMRPGAGAIGEAAPPSTNGGPTDEALLAAIEELEARTSKGTYYDALGVPRDADKKTIKRAYFKLAAEAHPDRFYGKKIGDARARVELVFRRITEAHDALTDTATRRNYDARLPPLPKARPTEAKDSPPSPRKSSRGMKAVSRRMAAVKVEEILSAPVTAPPISAVVSTVVSAPVSDPVPSSVPAMRPPPVVASSAPPKEDAAPISARSAPRMDDLRAGMLAARTQARVDMLVKAGEEALAANDIVGAANSYRLALEHKEDLRLRFIFEDLDARSRALRFDKHMNAARLAENEQRWADAAVFLQRANDAKPDCDVAWRAATAIRLSDGDLQRALTLAEQAVAIAPRNPEYRLSLAVICLATKRMQRAREETEEARKLAPKDEQIQARARDIAKKAL